jgi:hypothetical protein
MHANVLCLTHNRMLLLEHHLENREGMKDEVEDRKKVTREKTSEKELVFESTCRLPTSTAFSKERVRERFAIFDGYAMAYKAELPSVNLCSTYPTPGAARSHNFWTPMATTGHHPPSLRDDDTPSQLPRLTD